ncbi:hypothetical protein FF011L_19920 [Roseimaritima multifibrata]|uniref:Uncharacterized protein n=1 Tax=Roseimaritima multifibrata TaxID=1930274 RepID=A0A517MEC3_9BACT|nr:hypothetical protein [Roseimaritima multifibrata]QDS93231.1 hypothetical protein FF011L_19920 [Roseimaritima multifibrata]
MTQPDTYDLPDDRILIGPGDLRIAVPYKPPRGSDDPKADWPPFDPPLVWVSDYEGRYRTILRTRIIERSDKNYTFSTSQLAWLDAQNAIVEQMLTRRRND